MKKLRLLTYLVFCSTGLCFSQSVTPPQSIEVFMEVTPNDTTVNWGDTLFQSTTNLKGTLIIILQDTSGIANIHVKLGTTDGGNNLFQKVFSYNSSGNFTDGTSMFRNGLVIAIGLGNFTGINIYYAEVRLEDSSQNLSPVIKYNNL